MTSLVDLETKCRAWAKPPGTTEEQRCKNAEQAISNAIKASDRLKSKSIEIFTQGSYANNTNVRGDSDVDVAVVCSNTFFYDLPDGYSAEYFGLTNPASYHYRDYKNDIDQALQSYFTHGAATRGNKAFDLHETSYHVDADVAPFFDYRLYRPDQSYSLGVKLAADDGSRIVNWPRQHLQRGKDKNIATNYRYKAIVRNIKALALEMNPTVDGFLLECLVYNIPNEFFGADQYTDDLDACLRYLYAELQPNASGSHWNEVSGLKALFGSHQKWTQPQASQFIANVYNRYLA